MYLYYAGSSNTTKIMSIKKIQIIVFYYVFEREK